MLKPVTFARIAYRLDTRGAMGLLSQAGHPIGMKGVHDVAYRLHSAATRADIFSMILA